MLPSRIFAFALSSSILGLAYPEVASASSVIVEQLRFDTNPAPDVSPVKLTATLSIPHSDKPVAAMVIINSSGGVLDKIEGHYARSLVQNGIAALVVDSFKPRKVVRTDTNQSLVTSWTMENDAFAAFSELRKDKRSIHTASA